MIGKKINQLATELAPTTTDLTIIGDPVTGVSKKITLEQLGAIFGGAVSFYTTLGDFPVTGVIDIIYCAKDTKKLYLWSGSAYVEVFPSQSLLDTYQLRSEKGVSNGYASLDVNGKVPIGQLPNSIMEYKGTWNAATNTPTLANGTGDTGDVYICNVAGTVNFGAGPITFAVGDYVVYSGTIWQRSSGAVGTVTSVGLSITGDSIGVTGSPITTSGTLALAFAGTGAQYIKGDGTLATFPSIISQAQNLVTEVYNNTGATLTKGTIVYINGGQGNLPTVTKALATGDSTSAQTYGVVQTDITNMNNGYVVVAGRLTDLDTQAYTEGTQLYLSATTAGTWTPTKQYAPNHLVYVGIVVRSHPTQGVVEIKIQNGYEMDELHNVAAPSPDNNDILQYKSATSLWTNVAGTTTNIAEGTNLYYTDARSRAALGFTAGSGAYNIITGVITIPTNTNQLTNGAAFITLASLSAGAGISYNNTTGVIASTITQYTDALARAAISLTTTGTSGAATYNNTTGVLNIPQYQTALTNPVTGTGTTNYLPKFTGTSALGNSPIFDDSGKIGIGTATPDASFKLTISGNSAAVSPGIYFNDEASSPTNYALYTNGSKNFVLRNQSTANNIAVFTPSGNLGLGVTPSAWASGLSVFQGSSSLSVGNSGNGGMNVLANAYYGSNWTYVSSAQASWYQQIDGKHAWHIAPSGTAGNAISFTQAMTLNASGFLGIGETNPTSRLHIFSGVGGSSTTPMILLQNDASAPQDFLRISDIGATPLDVFIVKGNGNVGIGTTSPFSTAKFQVKTTTNINLGFQTGTTDSTGFKLNAYNDDGSANIPFELNGSTLILKTLETERMRITSGGDVGIGTTTVTAPLTVAGTTDLAWSASTSKLQISRSGTVARLQNYENGSAASLALQWDGGNVGIGTTSPATRLHIEAPSASYGLLRITSTTGSGGEASINFGRTDQAIDNRWTVGQGTASIGDSFGFYSGGVNRLVLTTSGAATFSSTIQTASPSSGSAHAWKLGSYAAGGTGTATGVIYIEVNGQIYSIPALLGTP